MVSIFSGESCAGYMWVAECMGRRFNCVGLEQNGFEWLGVICLRMTGNLRNRYVWGGRGGLPGRMRGDYSIGLLGDW